MYSYSSLWSIAVSYEKEHSPLGEITNALKLQLEYKMYFHAFFFFFSFSELKTKGGTRQIRKTDKWKYSVGRVTEQRVSGDSAFPLEVE